jgi:hypothetical protein
LLSCGRSRVPSPVRASAPDEDAFFAGAYEAAETSVIGAVTSAGSTTLACASAVGGYFCCAERTRFSDTGCCFSRKKRFGEKYEIGEDGMY